MGMIDPPRERVAVLAGATGLVGGFCLDLLLSSPRYELVHALGRRPPDRDHERLNKIETDFSDLAEAGLGHVDDVFCCLGTTLRQAGGREAFRAVDYDLPVRLAQVARDCTAAHFSLVSSLGADPSARSFYLRVKGETERAIAAVGIRSLAFLRPSLILGPRREPRIGETVGKFVASAFHPIMVGPLRRYRAVEARDVAHAMILVAASVPFGTHVIESETISRMVRESPPSPTPKPS